MPKSRSCDPSQAASSLEQAEGDIKTAVLLALGIDKTEAENILMRCDGNLRRVFAQLSRDRIGIRGQKRIALEVRQLSSETSAMASEIRESADVVSRIVGDRRATREIARRVGLAPLPFASCAAGEVPDMPAFS